MFRCNIYISALEVNATVKPKYTIAVITTASYAQLDSCLIYAQS